ncbi:hypothetical protein KXV85_000866, partial [Aspergillus fumigatus]
IWRSRPTSPAFYLCAIAAYFVQPLADLIIYRGLWKGGKALRLSILLRKRHINSFVFDYSGEAYFYLWAQRTLQTPKSELLHTIKDSNILSAAAGLTTAIAVGLLLVVSGDVRLLNFDVTQTTGLAIAVGVGAVPLLLAGALVLGGQRITTLNRKEVVWTYGIHLARSVVALVLLFATWLASQALPSVQYCFYVVALRVLISRLPLLPRKEIIFAGATLAAAQFWDLHSQSIAAVLVVTTTINDVLGFLLVGIPWLFSRLSPWISGPA